MYEVVVNDRGQYSIWPAGQEPPAGWRPVGVRGEKEACLRHIDEVWTDLRPANTQ